jgi:hypothetical protein
MTLNDKSTSIDIAQRFYGAQGRDYPPPEPQQEPRRWRDWQILTAAVALAVIGCVVLTAVTETARALVGCGAC